MRWDTKVVYHFLLFRVDLVRCIIIKTYQPTILNMVRVREKGGVLGINAIYSNIGLWYEIYLFGETTRFISKDKSRLQVNTNLDPLKTQ